MSNTSAEVSAQQKATSDITSHQKAIVDYALAGAAAAYAAQTNELIARTRVVVNNELNQAFATQNKLTLSRKIGLGLGAVAVFALGWVGKSWSSRNDKPETPVMVVD